MLINKETKLKHKYNKYEEASLNQSKNNENTSTLNDQTHSFGSYGGHSLVSDLDFDLSINLSIYGSIDKYTHTHTHTYIYMYIYIYSYVYIYIYMYMNMKEHTCTHTHTHTIYIYIYIYSYIYIRALIIYIYIYIYIEVDKVWFGLVL